MLRLYEVLDHLSEINEVGNTPPVDIYPFLHWVPERFLGMWKDYARLPYVAAIVKEANRWRPVVPMAFPHTVAEGEKCFRVPS